MSDDKVVPFRQRQPEEPADNNDGGTGTLLDNLYCLTHHREELPDGRVLVNQRALDELLEFFCMNENPSLKEKDETYLDALTHWRPFPLKAGTLLGEANLRRFFDPANGLPFTKIMDFVVQTCPPPEVAEMMAEEHRRKHNPEGNDTKH